MPASLNLVERGTETSLPDGLLGSKPGRSSFTVVKIPAQAYLISQKKRKKINPLTGSMVETHRILKFQTL
jgi:hypothetical protein